MPRALRRSRRTRITESRPRHGGWPTVWIRWLWVTSVPPSLGSSRNSQVERPLTLQRSRRGVEGICTGLSNGEGGGGGGNGGVCAKDGAEATAAPVASATPAVDSDTFHVVVMDRFAQDLIGTTAAARRQKYARVFATYGGARVTMPMRLNTDAGEEHTRFRAIIDMHERIKAYTNREEGTLPDEAELIAFGTDLFETLFQGDVRRLYDEARARQHQRKLDFVFTSMVSWIAEKPWEFAYDPSRRSFLATEDIHFVRNVLTTVPADLIPPRPGPLRILVASAQPAGFGRLSVQQELEVIRRGFDPLDD